MVTLLIEWSSSSQTYVQPSHGLKHIALGRMKEAFVPVPSFAPSFSADSDVWPAKVVTTSVVNSKRIRKRGREEKSNSQRAKWRWELIQTCDSEAARLGGCRIYGRERDRGRRADGVSRCSCGGRVRWSTGSTGWGTMVGGVVAETGSRDWRRDGGGKRFYSCFEHLE